MASIKDVAMLAGLSVSVVSKYLKDSGSVRTDTKQRVEAAIDALGYMPSSAARALRTGKNNMFAFIVPDISRGYYARLFQQLCAEGRRRGLSVILQESSAYTVGQDNGFATPQPFHPEFSVPAFQPVDGIFVSLFPDPSFPRKLAERVGSVPVIPLGWIREPLDDRPAILHDYDTGFYNMTKHLLELGHRRIAYVGDHMLVYAQDDKFNGYQRALQEAGLDPDPNLQFFGMQIVKTGFLGAAKVLNTPDPPTAIVTESDELAASCIKYAEMRHLRVPEDLAVTGCDNLLLSALCTPSITTLKLPTEEICRVAIDLAVESFAGKAKRESITFVPELVVRGSTVKDAEFMVDLG